jgi:MarR family transcriptional regulator, organic hydroperoxide resistance regulator
MEPVKTRLKAIDSVYANSLYFASGFLARQVDKLATEVWKPSGLPPAQGYLLLHVLNDHLYPFPNVISNRLLLSPSAITHLVEKLEKKELVWRYYESNWMYIAATQKATDLKPVLIECERNFIERCDALLGADAGMLTSLMNRTADQLYESREKR